MDKRVSNTHYKCPSRLASHFMVNKMSRGMQNELARDDVDITEFWNVKDYHVLNATPMLSGGRTG
jgi:hypothetical protein